MKIMYKNKIGNLSFNQVMYFRPLRGRKTVDDS